MTSKRNILVAPLNWGLGHATRCIPIINKLLAEHYNPIIASDGEALKILTLEFPELETITLPSYHFRYPKNGVGIKLSLLLQVPKLLQIWYQERRIIDKLIAKHDIDGIISDGRFGIYSNKVPSVYLTHQLNVMSGWSTFLTTYLHQSVISKFDECWVPDNENSILSGKLSQKKMTMRCRFIGNLSRFQNLEVAPRYDIMVLLSGLEPNRTNLEERLFEELKDSANNILFVRGKVASPKTVTHKGPIEIHNFMLSSELELAINSSKLIIMRSGYSSIMDIAALQKKCFVIPTTGQTEQEYLAHHLEQTQQAPNSSEEDFRIEHLGQMKDYQGFSSYNSNKFPVDLFYLFQGKGEF